VPVRSRVSPIARRIQRIAANENPFEEDARVVEGPIPGGAEEEQVQTLRPAGKGNGPAGISRSALSSGEGGSPLPPSVRAFMEPRFGADFSGVQVHSDGRAANLASSVSARAFAYGKHLYFNEGEYQPHSDAGRRVLAHELTHVVQQGADEQAPVRRLGPTGTATGHGIMPWPTGPIGANYEATTDAGSAVSVWKGYPIFPYDQLFWCHGHSLGTMYTYGYSVYSGPPLAAVITDEYVSVPPDQTRAGDIAVWTARLNHSAKFTNPVIQNGALDHTRSELSTKNGQRPLSIMTLDAIEAIYGTAGVAVYRHR
jgi:hypothetical protein